MILCFERRFTKQNSVIRLKSKTLTPQIFCPPPNFWAGYAAAPAAYHGVSFKRDVLTWTTKILMRAKSNVHADHILPEDVRVTQVARACVKSFKAMRSDKVCNAMGCKMH